MAKFDGKTVILTAICTNPKIENNQGVSETVLREKFLIRNKEQRTRPQKAGSIKSHAEDGANVVAEDKIAEVRIGTGVSKMELVSGALFDLYLDSFTTSGTVSNKDVEFLIGKSITLSEIKVLENGWLGDGSFFTACNTASTHAVHDDVQARANVGKRIDLYNLINSIQTSAILISGITYNAFGDLEHGQGSSTNCSDQVALMDNLKTNLLLKVVDGDYINKIPGMSDDDWEDLLDDASRVDCD